MSKLEQSAKTAQETASLLASIAQDHKAKGNRVGYKNNKEDAASQQKLADHLKAGNFKAAVKHYDEMPETVKDHAKDLDDGKLHAHLSSALKEMVELVEVFEGLGLSEDTGAKMLKMVESAQEAAYNEGFEDANKTLAEAKAAAAEEAKASLQESIDAKDREIALVKEAAEAYATQFKNTLLEATEEYVNQAIEEFVEQQKANFVQTDQFNRMKTAFEMMKESFEVNGFEINENKKVDSLKEALEEVSSQYDEVYSELKESREQVEALSQAILAERAFSGLTDTQKEKANSLLEGTSFKTVEDFERGLKVIAETVTKKSAEKVKPLTEEASVHKIVNKPNMDFRGLL